MNKKQKNANGVKTKSSKGLKIFIVIAAIVCIIAFAYDNRASSPVTPNLAVIDVAGEIGAGDTLLSSATYDHDWTMKTMDKLSKSKFNKGLLIRIDSPGGSVYTSDEIYDAIKAYKKTGKPVYVYMESMAASGGYYISAPCDKIYANRNCWTGSIGVTTGTMYNVSGLLDKLGITTTTIASGRNKGMGSQTEEMTAEQRQIFQGLIDEAYDQFVDIVAEGRHMDRTKVLEIADGRIYSAKQAEALGLIDGVMTEDQAIDLMKKKEHLKYCDVKYLQPGSDDKLFALADKAIRLRSSAQMTDYAQLLELIRGGNKFTVSYTANISK